MVQRFRRGPAITAAIFMLIAVLLAVLQALTRYSSIIAHPEISLPAEEIAAEWKRIINTGISAVGWLIMAVALFCRRKNLFAGICFVLNAAIIGYGIFNAEAIRINSVYMLAFLLFLAVTCILRQKPWVEKLAWLYPILGVIALAVGVFFPAYYQWEYWQDLVAQNPNAFPNSGVAVMTQTIVAGIVALPTAIGYLFTGFAFLKPKKA